MRVALGGGSGGRCLSIFLTLTLVVDVDFGHNKIPSRSILSPPSSRFLEDAHEFSWADFNIKRAEQSALLGDQPPEQIQDPPVLVKVEDVSVVQNTLNARQAHVDDEDDDGSDGPVALAQTEVIPDAVDLGVANIRKSLQLLARQQGAAGKSVGNALRESGGCDVNDENQEPVGDACDPKQQDEPVDEGVQLAHLRDHHE
mmetsp:Transcript_26495/g.60350  ORF Transcript_26495/g.60350 Transcript_26495/m.60350 type:complete len:200 (-) Transcript_26495:1330-1929(-)